MHFKGCRSGVYGKPPKISYWIRQTAIYVIALTSMKLVVILLFAIWPGIIGVGQWLLSWTGGGGSVQVILYVQHINGVSSLMLLISVMGIFPICMNILQFWLIDSIVKASTSRKGN